VFKRPLAALFVTAISVVAAQRRAPTAPIWNGKGAPPEEVLMFGPSTWIDYGLHDRRHERRLLPTRPTAMQTASNYNNIRIQIVYGTLSVTSAQDTWMKGTLIPQMTSYLQQLFKVYPTTGTFYVPRSCSSGYTDGSGKCAEAATTETCGSNYGTVPDQYLGALNTYASGSSTPKAVGSGSYAAGSGGFANKDLILFVTATSTGCTTGTLAFAGSCKYDQYDRPVTGFVNFCPNMVDTSAAAWEAQWATAVHEAMHALGFSSSRFAYFWDHSTGKPRTDREAPTAFAPPGAPSLGDLSYLGGTIKQPGTAVLASSTERGGTVWKIKTSTAIAKARTHFDCTSLDGVELENEGGAGTAGSHWEQRIFQNEAMTGVSRESPVVSPVTMGYFEDTGWYIADYAYTGTLQWGKGKGCSFATGKCLTAGNPPTKTVATSQFCTTLKSVNTDECGYNNVGWGVCNAQSNSPAPPSPMQYFSTSPAVGGAGSTMDSCPFVAPYSNGQCQDSADQPTTSFKGETYGKSGVPNSGTGYSSRCFPSTLVASGQSFARNVGCYNFACNSTLLKVTVACAHGATSCTAQTLDCPTAGGALSVPNSLGFTAGGSITCPTYASVCGTGGEVMHPKQRGGCDVWSKMMDGMYGAR